MLVYDARIYLQHSLQEKNKTKEKEPQTMSREMEVQYRLMDLSLSTRYLEGTAQVSLLLSVFRDFSY